MAALGLASRTRPDLPPSYRFQNSRVAILAPSAIAAIFAHTTSGSTTAKAGVIGFTRALARELGPEKINVNVILPGLTLSDTQVASSKPGYINAEYDQRRALQRAQYPEDLQVHPLHRDLPRTCAIPVLFSRLRRGGPGRSGH